MSFYQTGFDNYSSELEKEGEKFNKVYINYFRVAPNGRKEAIFLDDTGFRFQQHNVYNPATKKSEKFTCKGEGCVLCQVNKPGLVTVVTAKDLTGYLDQRTNQRKGIGTKLIFAMKRDSSKRMNRVREAVAQKKAENYWQGNEPECRAKGLNSVEEVKEAFLKKGNVLKNVKISCERVGDRSEACGDTFMEIGQVPQNQLAQDDVPFNYEEIFKPEENNIIFQKIYNLFAGNVSPTWLPIMPQNLHVTEQNNSQNFQGMQEDYNEAPSFTHDDIPF